MLFLISPSESEKQEFTEAVNLHYSFKFVYFFILSKQLGPG